MTDAFLNSSDSVRSARPLRHAQQVTFDGPLELEQGGRLPSVTVAYETYGRLAAEKDNAVLICHAISGDSHVARHDENDDAGWWDAIVGPGKAIDTDRYFVICPNLLGGCRGTTGPNCVNPATDRPYGHDFPTVTIGDMVEVQRRLIDHLGIERLLGVAGGSMGGHMALCWARRYPRRVRGAIPIATSPRLTSQALAFDVVGRNAILRDPCFRGGQYYDQAPGPDLGLAIARMIGHITYLSPEAMKEKFEADRHRPRQVATDFEKRFSVGSYLGYQADKFVERFDANSYITLSMAMDLYDLGATRDELISALRSSSCRWLVISFTSDWLFPPEQSRQIVDALIVADKRVSFANVASTCGHDAFLLPNDADRYGELIRAFLDNLSRPEADTPAPSDELNGNVRSIFHHRLDYDRIVELMRPGACVLDLGCGNGELLVRLKRRGHSRIVGAEIDEEELLACVRRGLDVVQLDLNRGLSSFADKQFDYVVLSQTLQSVRDVEGIIGDMLRVGRRCIVSFPNFAYSKLRTMMCVHGRAPRSPDGLLHYEWYDTPNIRFCSIEDFRSFCADKGIRTEREIYLDTEKDQEVSEDPNLNADLAIFVIGR
ncbi:MAG TPA: homoserine O-acetyltransferase [Phycisphaerae bacterium]|nr:homoserine O-acetyltransferase [Phycisphaerae bacterium]